MTLSRSAPLRRGGSLKRGPWRNPKRREFLERRRARKLARVSAGPWPGLDYAAYIRKQDCALRGVGGHRCGWPVDAAHVVRRTRGGLWFHQAPLCRDAHRLLDKACRNDAERFLARTGIDLRSLAATLLDRFWRDHGAPPPGECPLP